MIKPFYEAPGMTIYCGNCRDLLPQLDENSVHCVITSPPYWGLRDYGVDGQLGLEKTPEEYVQKMVEVFREVARVLRDDGTLWLNMGDSYASAWACKRRNIIGEGSPDETVDRGRMGEGLKEKDLCGIPWRVAFALQADGWYLRSDIIWSKPNSMPESVTDRPTKSHEYLFLLTKSLHYFFDQQAVREGNSSLAGNRKVFRGYGDYTTQGKSSAAKGLERQGNKIFGNDDNPSGRNIRTVWTIATQPFPEPHFATFPEKLVEPCLKAGTSERGCCPKCGGPWVRNLGEGPKVKSYNGKPGCQNKHGQTQNHIGNTSSFITGEYATKETLGWQPSCDCGPYTYGLSKERTIPCTVLDPFAGAGTVGVVAQKYNRRFVGLELKMDYCKMTKKRIAQTDVAMF